MQVEPIQNPTVLSQGSIFRLDSLSFQIPDRKNPATFQDFYPYLGIESAKFGVVMSQDCDLFRDASRETKITHISVALIEPISTVYNKVQTSKLNNCFYAPFESDPSHELHDFRAYDFQKLHKILAKDLCEIINNNHKYLYFLELSIENPKQYSVVNVSKTVPLRIDHYDAILSSVCARVKTEFANKLGWKLAHFYGRVGTPDYSEGDLLKIAKELNDLCRPDLADSIGFDPEQFKILKEINNIKNHSDSATRAKDIIEKAQNHKS